MKTTPTETDREAAQLFAQSPGMRVLAKVCGVEDDFWSRASRHSDVGGLFCDAEPTVDECKWVRPQDMAAIDTDDDATKGVMLAQLRAETDAPRLHVVCGDPDPDGVAWWSIAWWNAPRRLPGRSAMNRTEGAALVAAKRALAEAAR